MTELTADAGEPELLIGEYTKVIQRWNLSIDIPDDGQGAIPALLVTAVVEPKKKNSSGHHKKVILGFAVPYNGDLSNYLEAEAYEVDVQGQSASFKFKEKIGDLKHEDKHCTIDLSLLMP